jgi:hypothetical protein
MTSSSANGKPGAVVASLLICSSHFSISHIHAPQIPVKQAEGISIHSASNCFKRVLLRSASSVFIISHEAFLIVIFIIYY